MVAGFNLRFTVWRMGTVLGDDVIGGAIATGTPLYLNVYGRLEGLQPTQVFLEQGLEVDRIYACLLRPGTLDIREHDQLEVVWPPEHPSYEDRFRVVGIRDSSLHPRDGRRSTELRMAKIERSRAS